MGLLSPLLKRNMMAAAKDIAPVVGMSAMGGVAGGMNSPSEEMTPNAIVLGALMGAGAGRVGQRMVGKLVGKPSGMLKGVKRSASGRMYKWDLPQNMQTEHGLGEDQGMVSMTRDLMLGNKPEELASGIRNREFRDALYEINSDKSMLAHDRDNLASNVADGIVGPDEVSTPQVTVSMWHNGDRDLVRDRRGARDLFGKTFAALEDHMERYNTKMYRFSPATPSLMRLYTSRMLEMPRHRYVPIQGVDGGWAEGELALVHPHIAHRLTSGPDWEPLTQRAPRVPKPKPPKPMPQPTEQDLADLAYDVENYS